MNRYLTVAAAISAMCVTAMADLTPTDNVKLALNMYSNQRARQVGDLLTVEILENNTSKKTEDLSTSKALKANADAPLFGYDVNNASNMFQQMHNFFVRSTEQSIMPIGPEYKIEAASSFDGKGSTNSTDYLKTEFTVRVVDVLENGVLVVRGDRKIMIRLESVSMVLSGLVRTRDIDSDNKVSSTRLADAHIYYETGGEVSRGTRPGYVWRIFQFLNPF